ncbi:MAG: hypothetical protein KGJ13_05405 [Patescibacteria group bacterium]|nr:hypothetical protein [Patescibacteria group bacterium]
MNELVSGVVTIAVAIIGVALLATLVSRNANTAGILSAGGNSLATALGAAEAPVTGANYSSMFHLGDTQTGPGFYG